MYRFALTCCLICCIAVFGGAAGCSRQHYRTKADHEVYSLLKQGTNDSRWHIDDYRINPKAQSRMFDPYHPDKEPMPTDDPAAHAKMHSAGMRARDCAAAATPLTENPSWKQFLLINGNGEVPLDKEKAVDLALLHSPEYQSALENLYLAAMKVSQERFRYDVQFYGGDSIFYTATGHLKRESPFNNDADIGAKKVFATGGELVVGLANSITWSFSSNAWNVGSIFNVSVVQPLLRGAGRKIVLEDLTQSERDFLAAVRQMVFFQQGYYTKVVTGSGQQAPPSGSVSGGNTPSVSGGFFGLLAEQIRIQNQRQNIVSLEENLNRFIEIFEAGQIDDVYQIEETRQNLLVSQSSLLGRTNSYQSNIETYIRSLGLPPDLSVEISDPLLEQFQLMSPTLTVLQEDVAALLSMIRKKDQPLAENFRDEIKEIVHRAEGEIAVLEQDLETLQKSIPARKESLRILEEHLAERIQHGERIDPSIYDTNIFENRINELREKNIPQNLARLRAAFTLLDLIVSKDEKSLRKMIRERSFAKPAAEALETLKLLETVEADSEIEISQKKQELEESKDQLKSLQEAFGSGKADREKKQKIITELRQKDTYRDWIRRVLSTFQYELVSLSLMQTRTRLDAITLVPVSVTPEEAFQTASANRLDWMNRRAQLVDTWRQIDIAADQLRGALNLTLDGDMGTVDRNGVRFSGDNSQLKVGLNWESPLTRHGEMLDYRRSQIAYQNARRNYYTYVDSVQAELRNILRNAQMNQIDFEINRNAILVDTVRVDVMQLRMEQPPQRGKKIDTNTAQQLIGALNGLMSSQNSFLNTWVAYQTQRMLLDLNMGTMTLDRQGRWIDSGAAALQPNRPLPIAVPVEESQPIYDVPKLNRRYVEEKQ